MAQAFATYRVTPLREIKFVPNPEFHGTMGINNKGQVVYGVLQTIGQPSSIRAWAWLPENDYNMNMIMIDLETQGGISGTAIARDINMSGKITGAAGGMTAAPSTQAVVWELSNGSATTTATLANSVGHSITDTTPLNIAGERSFGPDAVCDSLYTRALYWKVGDNWYHYDPTAPYQNQGSSAFDIARDGEWMVGISEPCSTVGLCPALRGSAWYINPGMAFPLGEGGIQGDALVVRSRAYGINDDYRIAGWVRYHLENSLQCLDTAAYWSSPSASPIDLGLLMPGYQEGHQSQANAINSRPLPQVVGQRVEPSETGMLWEYTGTQWICRTLNSVILSCNNQWEVIQGHDINDDGWIVAYARRTVGTPPSTERWSVLLTPIGTCPEDVNHDGVVDVNDLNIVMTSDGQCPASLVICWSDVNGDCQVNTLDQRQVIAAYGPCGGFGSGLNAQTIDYWYAAGGEERIANHTITAPDVASCLDEPTPGDRVVALFQLISE